MRKGNPPILNYRTFWGHAAATEIADVLYGEMTPPGRRRLADAQVRSGLRKLTGEGMVRAVEDGYALA